MKIYTIYLVTNNINGKTYVGFDSRWPTRKNSHINNVSTNRYPKLALYKAMKKYGLENFSWQVLYQSLDRDHTLNEMEPYFISETNSYIHAPNSNGYNLTKGGEGTFGYKHTQEFKDHQKMLQSGKSLPEETIKKISNTKKGNSKRTPGSFTKGSVPWNYGAIMSEDFSKKCSFAQKERFKDPDEYDKLAEARKLGQKAIKENCLKLIVRFPGHSVVVYSSVGDFCKLHSLKTRIVYHHTTKNAGIPITKGKLLGYTFWLVPPEKVQEVLLSCTQ